jgi:hypothetical protein
VCEINEHAKRLPARDPFASARRTGLCSNCGDRRGERQTPRRHERKRCCRIQRIDAARHLQRDGMSLAVQQQCTVISNIKVDHANPSRLCGDDKWRKCWIGASDYGEGGETSSTTCS